jgi:hypothetical protein
MASAKFISNLRVSTARQGASGLGLEGQREAVSRYLNGGRWRLVQEVVEVETGKRNDRPAIAEAPRLRRLDCLVYRGLLVASNQGFRCRTSCRRHFSDDAVKFTTFCNLLLCCDISSSFPAYSSIRWTRGASLRKAHGRLSEGAHIC